MLDLYILDSTYIIVSHHVDVQPLAHLSEPVQHHPQVRGVRMAGGEHIQRTGQIFGKSNRAIREKRRYLYNIWCMYCGFRMAAGQGWGLIQVRDFLYIYVYVSIDRVYVLWRSHGYNTQDGGVLGSDTRDLLI